MYSYEELVGIIAELRSDHGCPWDKAQTHESLIPCLRDECEEVVQAIEKKDGENLCEELGDVLLQVVMNSQIAAEMGAFTIEDVIDGVSRKMVRRHPHVFGGVTADDAGQVLKNWDAIKRADRGQQSAASAMDGIPRGLPGLMRSEKIQGKAAKLGFDWPEVSGAMDKLREEVGELQEGIDAGDVENIKEELGDVLFSAVNVARFYKLDCEELLHAACRKFIRRFRYLEEGAASRGKKLEDMTLAEMEEIYQQSRHDLEGKEPVPVQF